MPVFANDTHNEEAEVELPVSTLKVSRPPAVASIASNQDFELGPEVQQFINEMTEWHRVSEKSAFVFGKPTYSTKRNASR